MNKRTYLFLFFTLFIINKNIAQSSEIGVSLGANTYLGELNKNPFSTPRLAIGAIYRYSLENQRVVIRGTLNFGYVNGADSLQKTAFEQYRNLSFRSRIIELSGIVEVNFIKYEIGDNANNHTPYMYSGLTYFHINPQAEIDGDYKDLQPLGTEGQGIEGYGDYYSKSGIAIPFGVGYKVNLSSVWALNIEWGIRFTFSDYIDDVSNKYVDPLVLSQNNGPLTSEFADRSVNLHQEGEKRGNPYNNDIYTFFGAMLTYRIGGKKDPCSYLKKM